MARTGALSVESESDSIVFVVCVAGGGCFLLVGGSFCLLVAAHVLVSMRLCRLLSGRPRGFTVVAVVMGVCVGLALAMAVKSVWSSASASLSVCGSLGGLLLVNLLI